MRTGPRFSYPALPRQPLPLPAVTPSSMNRCLPSATRGSWLIRSVRYQSTPNYFQLFPQTFGGAYPPATTYKNVNLKALRKEFRALQATHHPDRQGLMGGEDGAGEALDEKSTVLNQAYNTLKEPLSRAQYILNTTIPKENRIDLTNDAVLTKRVLAKDKSFLMDVLDIHENLELVATEAELAVVREENDRRMEEAVDRLEEMFAAGDYDGAIYECAKLKYWCNIDDAVRNWGQQ